MSGKVLKHHWELENIAKTQKHCHKLKMAKEILLELHGSLQKCPDQSGNRMSGAMCASSFGELPTGVIFGKFW